MRTQYRNLEIKFLQKQLEAFKALQDPEVFSVLYGGAAGGGKTDLGCTWIILSCIAYPGTRWLIGRSKLSQLKSTTMKTFRDVCKRYRLKQDIDWSWPGNANEIKFANGSEIVLKDLFYYPSDPDFDSLGSLEITGAFIDEASQIQERAFEVIKSRIRYKLETDQWNLTPKILLTCNPSKNFLYTKFYLPWKQRKLPSQLRFIPALPTDNKLLPASYIENLKSLEEISYKRLYLGEWEYSNHPHALCRYDQILTIFNNRHVRRDGGTQLKSGEILESTSITVDPAYTGGDSTVILVWRGLEVIDHFEYSGQEVRMEKTIEEITKLSTQHNVPFSNIIIDVGGGYGNSIWEAFPGSFRFMGSASPYNKDYTNLRTECLYRLALAINNQEILISIENQDIEQRIIRECEQLKRDKVDADQKLSIVSKGVMKEGLRGRSPDFLDALSMRMIDLVKPQDLPADFKFFII